jgi:hypothetical protein
VCRGTSATVGVTLYEGETGFVETTKRLVKAAAKNMVVIEARVNLAMDAIESAELLADVLVLHDQAKAAFDDATDTVPRIVLSSGRRNIKRCVRDLQECRDYVRIVEDVLTDIISKVDAYDATIASNLREPELELPADIAALPEGSSFSKLTRAEQLEFVRLCDTEVFERDGVTQKSLREILNISIADLFDVGINNGSSIVLSPEQSDKTRAIMALSAVIHKVKKTPVALIVCDKVTNVNSMAKVPDWNNLFGTQDMDAEQLAYHLKEFKMYGFMRALGMDVALINKKTANEILNQPKRLEAFQRGQTLVVMTGVILRSLNEYPHTLF